MSKPDVMPLPAPSTEREVVHNRTFAVRGFRRSDGLWDVEGHLNDVRPQHLRFPGGERAAGESMHSMWLRLTVDRNGLIVDVTAVTDASPFPGVCGEIAPAYRGLIGLSVGPGFRGSARRLFAGVRGCTHMTELLAAMATAVIQTLVDDELQTSDTQQPFQLDGCHALAVDGPRVAAFYPRWYRKKGTADPAS